MEIITDQFSEAALNTCKTCKTELLGPYCYHCGQRKIAKRFQLKDSIKWVFHQLFNMDHGLFFTTFRLFKNPQKVLLDNITGATVKYLHPFRFIFIWATISVLISLLFGLNEKAQELGMPQSGIKAQEVGKDVQEFINKYLTLITIGTVPFFAFYSKLFFRKFKLNYAEHLIINSYSYGVTIAVGTLFYFLWLIPGFFLWSTAISALITVIIFSWIYNRFFQVNFLISLIKSFLIYIISYFTIILIGGVIAGSMAIINKISF
ncbi:DUF3667 domain-containing protein [Acidiluteibacter ferrifornacis]|uniref:DUF3667 domain-containing protein n=1 Tax=Acidiluteibacter ferrifornacis TaxID=2692424 RepID=A0A6N9NHZ7_9FLAO|nr:DUF3667 domain-containing protein [Acidiluteibacter ferrifornacis]NBG65523.1 DUF3667 domain-containing protein [Acidiluteibacter ferrifornacis]